MLLTEPPEPVASSPPTSSSAIDDEQVTRERDPLTHEGGERDRSGSYLVLHVERAATPDLPVDEIPRPRVAIPLRGIREHRIRVAEERQRRPVPALDPGDEICPLRHSRVELGLDPVRPEVVAQQLGRLGLVPRRVDRVEPEERLEERGDLVP